jgi:O-antigen ligase
VVANGPNRLMRPYGLTIHPNVVGGALVLGLLALGSFLARPKLPPKQSLLVLALWALGLWALCLTFSRSAWLALALGLGLAGFLGLRRPTTRWRLRPTLLSAGISLLILIGFAGAYWPYLTARAGLSSQPTELQSLAERRVLIEFATAIGQDHWLLGAGIGTFPWEVRDRIAASRYRNDMRAENVHNVPLLLWAELGLVGVGLWLTLAVIVAAVAWQRLTDPTAITMLAGWVALLAIGLVDHYPLSVLHFLALMWALPALVLHKGYD